MRYFWTALCFLAGMAGIRALAAGEYLFSPLILGFAGMYFFLHQKPKETEQEKFQRGMAERRAQIEDTISKLRQLGGK